MSESTAIETAVPQDGGAPAPEPAEAPAPAETGAEPTPETETTDETPKQSRADRRIAGLSARLAAQSAELDALRRAREQPQQPDAWPQTPEELERLIDARAEAKAAQQAIQARAAAFHEAGRAAHPEDWDKRCADLVAMGGDGQFSVLLLELPEGAKVAAALADDPEEMERIAAIRTERGRAIELGKYAAKVIEPPAAAPPRRQVSRAPAPIQPVTGSANLAFNPYAETDASELAARWMREDLDNRRKGNR